LNTTIPVHPQIPEEYWGREVSRYIGPVTIPVRTGEDSMRIFIDSDGDRETGFTAPWLNNIGAEYMITVTGRNMEVLSANYSRYVGNGNDWEWEHVDDVDVALNHTSLETEIDLELSDDARVTFVSSDWSEAMDVVSPIMAEEVRRIGDRLTEYRSTPETMRVSGDVGTPLEEKSSSTKNQRLYLRDGDAILPEMGDDVMSVLLRNQAGQDTHTWTSEPFAADFNITSAVPVRLYTIPVQHPPPHPPGLNLTLRHGDDMIGYGEMEPSSSEGWKTIYIETSGYSIPEGGDLSMDVRVTGEAESIRLEIHYNSEDRDSHLRIPTDTYISVNDLYTLNEEEEEQDVFYPGDTVVVNAEVGHPLDATLISETVVTVLDPEDQTIVEDVTMDLKENYGADPPYWSIFEHAFELGEHAPGGVYTVEVTSVDNQDISSTLTATFTVPSDPGVIVYPDGSATVEPGSWVDYEVNVRNIGNMDDEYELHVGESSRRWPTILSHEGEEMAIDQEGDGSWDWVNPDWDPDNTGKPSVSLIPLEISTFTLSKQVSEDANGDLDTTLLFADSRNYTQVHDSAVFTTYTAYPSEVASLYLHGDHTMDTLVGESMVSERIGTDESRTWVQEPPFDGDFNMIDRATVHLYIDPVLHGWRRPAVTVSIHDSGGMINSFTISGIEDEGWYEFPVVTDTLVQSGDQLELSISSSISSMDMYYDSQEYPARVEFNTDSYVRVEEVITLKNDTQEEEFWAGDTVQVNARITDPFGIQNIDSTTMTIYDPDGEVLVSDLPMSPIEGGIFSGSDGHWYEGEYELSEEALVGEYTAEVSANDVQALEDDENNIFQVPADVEVDPDHEGEGYAGTEVLYDHTITNMGRGNDRFELSVSSSLGYNITLYDEHGNMIARDIGGNGNWDEVDPAWDTTGSGSPDTGKLKMGESIGITLGVEIPENAETGVEDVTVLTATSSRDSSVSDYATDITSIPEFSEAILPVITVIGVFFGFFAYRRKKEKGDDEVKEEVEEKAPTVIAAKKFNTPAKTTNTSKKHNYKNDGGTLT